MSICAYCGAPGADLFTPHGDTVCQRCDAHFRAQMLEQRGRSQASADPTEAVASAMTFASPRTLLFTGAGLMLGAVSCGLLEVFAIGRVHLILLGVMFIAGFSAFARGIQG